MTGLEGLSSATIADARGKQGVLPPTIRRLHGSEPVCGRIVTASCAEGSASAMLRALTGAGEGDVLVVQGSGIWGYFGELVGAEAVRRGVRAVVVDGLLRDLDRLRELDLQLFAHGCTPQGAKPEGGGAEGVPLLIGDITVRPGDHLVGDSDGVVVVPADDVEAVAARAREIDRAESELWDRVLAGEPLMQQRGQYGAALGDLAQQS